MAHVYRAVWVDQKLRIDTAITKCFTSWLKFRNTPMEIKMNAVSNQPDRSLTAVQIDVPTVRGCQLHLVESLDDGRGTWSTTVTGMVVNDTKIIWVDVAAEAPSVWQRSINAPRVVRELLLSGGRPTSGNDPLEVQPREIDDQTSSQRFVESLKSELRRIPILAVVAGDANDVADAMQRATRASETLAGIAQLVVIEPQTIDLINRGIGPILEVEPGAAHLFLPGCSVNPMNPRLVHSVRHVNKEGDSLELGVIMARHIGHSMLWPHVEPSWQNAKDKIDEQRKRVQRRSTPGTFSIHSSTEVEMLREQVEQLMEQLSDSQNLAVEWFDYAQKVESELRSLEDKVVGSLLQTKLPNNFQRSTLATTIEQVQRASKWIVIPPTALQNIASLDGQASSSVWAKDLGRLFVAMENYAQNRSTKNFRGNFRSWCKKHGTYSVNKIAMSESTPTKNDEELMDARTFTVDTSLSPTGLMTMLAHAKIQEQGSGLIPRVFFHDDTGGQTKKIHIGFIGPHYLAPTSDF